MIQEEPLIVEHVPISLSETCELTYFKPVISEIPPYSLVTEMDFCQWIYLAFANGPEYMPETTWSWLATDSNTGLSVTGDGLSLDFVSILPSTSNTFGQVTIQLAVQNACGTTQQTLVAPYYTCGNGPGNGDQNRQIVITPNPANNQLSVSIRQNMTQDFVSNDPNGVRIRIYPSNGGVNALLDSYLYSNGQMFNTSTIPNGMYTVIATASDQTPIQTNLAIVR